MLSVVLTAYNRPAGLARTLQSIASQTKQPDELLISDDASPFDLTPVVEAWTSRLPQIKFFRQRQNLGMPGNLNHLMAKANGEFIANLHDGDVYPPGLLADWVNLLKKYPTAGYVFSGTTDASFLRKRQWHSLPEFMEGERAYKILFRNSWRGSSPVWGTVMARRSAYDQHMPFKESYGALADVDMWIRICTTHDVCFCRSAVIEVSSDSHFQREVKWNLADALRRIHSDNLARTQSLGWSRSYHKSLHHIIFQVYYFILLQSTIRKASSLKVKEGLLASKNFGLPASLLAYLA